MIGSFYLTPKKTKVPRLGVELLARDDNSIRECFMQA